MIEIRSLDDVGPEMWNSFVEKSHVYGAVYYRYEWLKSLEAGMARKAFNLAARLQHSVVDVFPNFLEERGPFFRRLALLLGCGGPIIKGKHPPAVLDALFGEVSAILRRTRSLVHRFCFMDFGGVQYSEYLRRRGYRPDVETCRLAIDLAKTEAEIESLMTDGERHELKKLRLGRAVTVVEAESTRETLAAFHHMYEDTMRRVNGNVIPEAFFTSLARYFPLEDIRVFLPSSMGTGSPVSFILSTESPPRHVLPGPKWDN